jgi:hypothetical protein
MIKLNVSGTAGKAVVPLYRFFSMISLYTILMGILWFGVLFGFFLASSSWVAPFMVTPSDTPVLAIIAQVTGSQATIDTLQLDMKASNENLTFSKAQLVGLGKLNKELREKLLKQTGEWAGASEDLKKYDAEAKTNIDTVGKDVDNGEELRKLVKRDLAAGLITNEDALATYSSIDMLKINTTAAKVAENDLKDSIRQHKMDDITSLTVDGQRAALDFQISQLFSAIRTDEQHIISDAETIVTINSAVEVAKQSPYYRAVRGKNVRLGIVPYSTTPVKVGTPVTNCKLVIAVCKQVGSVAAVYPNELVFENPLTKTNTRGYVIELLVTDDAMRVKALMIGKPLFF